VFGLLGNILSIIVLSHPKIRSSTSYYLITLAIYDNIILVSMEVFFNLPRKEIALMETYMCYFQYVLPVGYPISLAAQMGSIYTTVAFTVERYIAVCRPLHVSNTCTRSRARKTMALILIMSILYNIPRCFEYEATPHIFKHNKTCIFVSNTDFGNNEYYRHVYLIYFQLIFMFLIPFAILLVLNMALIKAVKRSRQNIRRISSSSRTNDNNLTVMLISVIFVFLFCQFPTIVDNIIRALASKETSRSVYRQKFYVICTFMVEINSAVNFILYCVFGKRFRSTFQHIF
ncbi:hypothetical protein LOTGIDRAFT_66365, partial [Lottia gigantea]